MAAETGEIIALLRKLIGSFEQQNEQKDELILQKDEQILHLEEQIVQLNQTVANLNETVLEFQHNFLSLPVKRLLQTHSTKRRPSRIHPRKIRPPGLS